MTIPAAGRALGSLCSGAGGLDVAVEQFFGAQTVWHAETDPAAAAVLAHRWPGVPNHGDLTTVDWAAVAPVDIIAAGWPCQPFSLAGKRKGAADERAIWPHIARAVRALRPGIVVLENVPAVIGSGSEFTRVANQLAEIGYDLRWRCLRACDIGAAHRRERVFILAELSTHTSGRRRHQRRPEPARQQRRSDAALSGAGSVAHLAPTPPASDACSTGGAAGFGSPTETTCDDVAELLPTPSAADGAGGHLARSGARSTELLLAGIARAAATGGLLPTCRTRDATGASAARAGRSGFDLPSALLPTPRAARGGSSTETSYALGGVGSDEHRAQGDVLLPTPNAADGNGGGRYSSPGHQVSLPGQVRLLPTPRTSDTNGAGRHGDGGLDLRTAATDIGTHWGRYESAIRRWEAITRPAPAPTEPNRNGNPRLSAAFSQWLMGWPAGWVSDPVIGISRNDQLRLIGNGVIPQQGLAALGWLCAQNPPINTRGVHTAAWGSQQQLSRKGA